MRYLYDYSAVGVHTALGRLTSSEQLCNKRSFTHSESDPQVLLVPRLIPKLYPSETAFGFLASRPDQRAAAANDRA